MKRTIALIPALILALAVAVPVAIISHVTSAEASPPLPCQETSDQLGTLSHGDPRTGLKPSPNVDDYYYLFVQTGASCPVTSTVHLVATVTMRDIVPAVGQPGTPPPANRLQRWWVLFHVGTGSSGKGVSLDNSKYVTESGGTPSKCQPTTNSNSQTCLSVPGTQTLTLRYDGPDVFGLSKGGAAGVRITNMATDGAIVTDHSTLTIVAS